MTDVQNVEQLLKVNFMGTTNDPIELARWIVEYEKQNGVRQGSGGSAKIGNNATIVTQSDIAKMFGINVKTLQRLKKLLKIIPDIQKLISLRRIKATTGYNVIACLSSIEQNELLRLIPPIGVVSQKQIEKLVEEIRNKT